MLIVKAISDDTNKEIAKRAIPDTMAASVIHKALLMSRHFENAKLRSFSLLSFGGYQILGTIMKPPSSKQCSLLLEPKIKAKSNFFKGNLQSKSDMVKD